MMSHFIVLGEENAVNKAQELKLKLDRDAMHQSFKEEKWKVSLRQSVTNFSSVSDKLSAKDLKCAVSCMKKLNDYGVFDTLMNIAEVKHSKNMDVLLEGIESLKGAPTDSILVGDEYVRVKDVDYAFRDTTARDRVRMLRFCEKAYSLRSELNKRETEALLDDWTKAVMFQRQYRIWRLKTLTNVTELPDFRNEDRVEHPKRSNEELFFYEVPATYLDAKNDGERWRWLLNEQMKLSNERKADILHELASKLAKEFSVNRIYKFKDFFTGYEEEEEFAEKMGKLQLHTLADDQMLIMSKGVVERFTLPDNQNFIRMYKQSLELGNVNSVDPLVDIYLTRGQNVKAADLLSNLLEKGEDPNIRRTLEGITTGEGRFLRPVRSYAKNQDKYIGLIFRNISSIQLTINEAPNIADERTKRLLGKQVAQKRYDLKPRKGHWDKKVYIKLPELKKAGMYIVSAKMENGKTFNCEIKVSEMVTITWPVNEGMLYLALDADTGKPIEGVECYPQGITNADGCVLLPKDSGLPRRREDSQYLKKIPAEQAVEKAYNLMIETPVKNVQKGKVFEVIISAENKDESPVQNAKVRVSISKFDRLQRWLPIKEWDWFYGNGYEWVDAELTKYPTWKHWGKAASFEYKNTMKNYRYGSGVMDAIVELGKDGKAKVRVDTALYNPIDGKDSRYAITVTDSIDPKNSIKHAVYVADRPYLLTTWMNKRYSMVGEKVLANVAANTLDGSLVNGVIKTTLHKIVRDEKGEINEKLVREWESRSFSGKDNGIHFKLDEAGQYRLVHIVTDAKNRKEEGSVIFTVLGASGEEGQASYSPIELIPDKRIYAAGEKVKLLVNIKDKDSYVMLIVRGLDHSPRSFIHVKGHSDVVEIPVDKDAAPNFFIEALTLRDAQIYTEVCEIIVPPVKKTLEVKVLADVKSQQTEKALKIKVTDKKGNPITGDHWLTIYDQSSKRIFNFRPLGYRSSGKQWMRRAYWYPRWNYSDNMLGNRAIGGYRSRYLRRNLHLVNRQKDVYADGIGITDLPIDAPDKFVESIAERYIAINNHERHALVHSGFCQNHMKWSGALKLDANGVAEVPVDYPDSSTIWTLQIWQMDNETRVGYGVKEIITSKGLMSN